VAKPAKQAHSALSQPIFQEPVFSEGTFVADPTGFTTQHPDDNALYQELGNRLKKDVVGVPKMRGAPDALFTLADAYGPRGAQVVDIINQSGQIVFHAIGDSGASNSRKYGNEVSVADQVTTDCRMSADRDRPAFLFHLGDVVYDFGEPEYYYDQFYEPFRNYPAPLLAIPGNHDSFVVPGTPDDKLPLTTFQRNFCATAPIITPEARSLHRTAMTQPGVYFAFDAPFVRIIGLFSNALEDPGVISSGAGKGRAHWPNVEDYQLEFLAAQLKRIKSEDYAGAVLLAVHHPPFSYAPPPHAGGTGGNHGSSSDMLREIDTICQKEGVYPHAFLSAHAHNYQRYTRTVHFGGQDFDVPFIVCGDGGHNVNTLVRGRKGQAPPEPGNGVNVDYMDVKPAIKTGGLLLEKHDDSKYGYLRISADKEQLRIGFHQAGTGSLPQSRFDMVTVQLSDHTMVSN
jgi:hypothetical protein